MILSIWRYSHLTLAVISVGFVLILSITGIILAFDPIASKMTGNEPVDDYPDVSLAQTIAVVQEEYSEVLSLSKDVNGFLKISVITDEGDLSEFYIHPLTGKKTGELIQQSSLMKFATNLHRSLFLKTTGRIIIGISSFLLFLITVSGLILIAKRQQGIKNFFRKIINENFAQYGHIYLGRLALLPLIIITLTGVYLSLMRFDFIPNPVISHDVDYEKIASSPQIPLAEFPVFVNSRLPDLRTLDFPFSDDPADYYHLSLHKKEVLVNQYTGEILSEIPYSAIVFLSEWNTVLHTGRGSILWSVILAVSSASILFFIWSGFKMTFKRRAGRFRNDFAKDACTYIILVGSETGSTMTFALQFYRELKRIGVKPYIAQLNDFEPFPAMEHLIVFTATYGLGEPPANAEKFKHRFQKAAINKPFNYSVVGFGSLAYADFCQYAFDVDTILATAVKSTRFLDVFTINNRSWEAFRQWCDVWGNRAGLQLDIINNQTVVSKARKKRTFELVSKSSYSDTFLLELKPNKSLRIKSGDLLAIVPGDGSHERLYSAGITADKSVLISVKLHNKGACSNYLNRLEINEKFPARVVTNRHFHLPAAASRVIMVSSGTGIAPFIGMIDSHSVKAETTLYWGGKTIESFQLYENWVRTNLDKGNLSAFHPAYSREPAGKNYVQDLLQRDAVIVAETLRRKGVVMICGSIAMQKGVSQVLDDICRKINNKPLSYYQKKGRVRMDCY